jgi:hypothetical protein
MDPNSSSLKILGMDVSTIISVLSKVLIEYRGTSEVPATTNSKGGLTITFPPVSADAISKGLVDTSFSFDNVPFESKGQDFYKFRCEVLDLGYDRQTCVARPSVYPVDKKNAVLAYDMFYFKAMENCYEASLAVQQFGGRNRMAAEEIWQLENVAAEQQVAIAAHEKELLDTHRALNQPDCTPFALGVPLVQMSRKMPDTAFYRAICNMPPVSPTGQADL